VTTFAPPAGVSGPTWTDEQVRTRIDTVAASYSLPAWLAEIAARVESGFDPYARGDRVNGQYTSFGLYQLHRGGELEALPGTYDQKIAAAYDPGTNARVALQRIAAVYHQDPNRDPGEIIAAAQRPADPARYARRVDELLGVTSTSSSSGAAGGATAVPAGAGDPFGSGTTTYKFTPIGPSLTIWSWPRIGFAVLGAILLLLGVFLAFRDGGVTLPALPSPAGGGNDTPAPRRPRRPLGKGGSPPILAAVE